MTYSIVARDGERGVMGVATQSQAFAVGSSVPFALPGHGVIAMQSMGEPMYGQIGLDLIRGGFTAQEALRALRNVDPHPERRQVAIAAATGPAAVYTGTACVEAAGHQVGDGVAALANMVAAPEVWQAMVASFASSTGPLAQRLLAALHAAEDEGGDIRGRRSAAVVVVRTSTTGRPWRDTVVDLRVDDSPDPVAELDRLVTQRTRYQEVVRAFEEALDGDPGSADRRLQQMPPSDSAAEPDQVLWRAVVAALAGREPAARELVEDLARAAPQFLETARRFGSVGLVPPEVVTRILPEAS